MVSLNDLKCYPPRLNRLKVKNVERIAIFYRYSDGGYKKEKPSYITKENCLNNFVSVFGQDHLTILADNVRDDTFERLTDQYDSVYRTHFGNGAQTLRLALENAMKLNDNTLVYLVEDDYLHRPGSKDILLEGINLGADYITLYDHPDKYMERDKGGNKYVADGGELTRVFLTKNTHWKMTNSTPMTFAALAGTLKEDKSVLWKYTEGTHPKSFKMFLQLRKKKRVLISPIPSFSTHGETKFLAPMIDWVKIQNSVAN